MRSLFRTLRPRVSLRVAMVVVAVVITLALKAAAIQDYHRRAPPSAKLLRPIVRYYNRVSEGDQNRQPNQIRFAGMIIHEAVRHLADSFHYAWIAIHDPQADGPGPSENWRMARVYLFYCVDSLRTVDTAFREAARYNEEQAYYLRLRDYYQQLLDKHRTELPPWPRELENERLASLKALRRISRRADYDLSEGPPPWLDPDPVRAKQRAPTRYTHIERWSPTSPRFPRWKTFRLVVELIIAPPGGEG